MGLVLRLLIRWYRLYILVNKLNKSSFCFRTAIVKPAIINYDKWRHNEVKLRKQTYSITWMLGLFISAYLNDPIWFIMFTFTVLSLFTKKSLCFVFSILKGYLQLPYRKNYKIFFEIVFKFYCIVFFVFILILPQNK